MTDTQKKLVFLGGTCGKNNWRKPLIEKLVSRGVNADCLFNPVVDNWDEAAQNAEEVAKENSTHDLFYIANPYLEGSTLSAYSMVEATMSLYDSQLSDTLATTVVVFDSKDIEGHSLKAFNQVEKVLRKRFPNAKIFGSLDASIDYLVDVLK